MTSYPPPPPGQNPLPAWPPQQPYGSPVSPPYGAPAQQPSYGAPVPPSYGTPPQHQYGAPAQQPYGVPQQPYGAPAPPPTVPVQTQQVTAPVAAWLVPLAALLAVIGVFTPWFKAKATATVTVAGSRQTIHHSFDGLYSFKDGKIGLLAPILLVVIAIGVVGLLLGRRPARFNSAANPVASAGKASIIGGGVSLVCVIIAWFLVKSQYKFTQDGRRYSWDEYLKLFKGLGVKLELSRGPQIGYFLTIAAGVLAIVAGILMVLAARSSSATPAPSAYPPAGANFGAAPGAYPPAPAGYGQPPPAGQPQFGPPQPGPPAPQGPPPPRY